MNSAFFSAILVAAAYLIGSIPFGYLTAKWLRGVDIRTVGSGNIGATNVGRVLGLRFFFLVFAFDFAKGLLPTWGFPILFSRLTGQPAPPELWVLVALATILGHTFPVYLRFKGGKGVATSLGAMLALDPAAGLASVFCFVVFLLITRYVSLSSMGGGLVYVLTHFARVTQPGVREERAMSLLTVGLMLLLVVRHRKNFARIAQGVEPKVSLRRNRFKARDGRITTGCILALVVIGASAAGGAAIWRRVNRHETLTVGPFTMTEVAHAATGHQRAERVAFADGGRLLAVTCPRYDRLVLYSVTERNELEVVNDLDLDGMPMAVCTTSDRMFVLERPAGDRRHVEPGWWQAYNLRGDRIGDKVVVGYYPDDLAITPDGRHMLVLTSGRAEGDAKKPAPALDVYEIAGDSQPVGHVIFEGKGDNPSRITLSTSGLDAAVSLLGSNVAAAIDLFDPTNPRLIGRSLMSRTEDPYPSISPNDTIMMPVVSGVEGVVIRNKGAFPYILSTLPKDSGVLLRSMSHSDTGGRLTLRSGALGLSTTRPTGLAYSVERGLVAVANRSGGVHLVKIAENFTSAATTTMSDEAGRQALRQASRFDQGRLNR